MRRFSGVVTTRHPMDVITGGDMDEKMEKIIEEAVDAAKDVVEEVKEVAEEAVEDVKEIVEEKVAEVVQELTDEAKRELNSKGLTQK